MIQRNDHIYQQGLNGGNWAEGSELKLSDVNAEVAAFTGAKWLGMSVTGWE